MNTEDNRDTAPAERCFTIEGKELGYPTQFHDGSAAMSVFSVPSKIANEIIADSDFEVVEIAPARTALSLICVHYTDTDCGSYEEIAFAFFVKKYGGDWQLPYLGPLWDLLTGKIASHTWYLPVTTSLAEQCGIQMWGYPKTIEDIRFNIQNGRAEFALHKSGEDILRFSVKAQGIMNPKPLAAPVYSVMDGKPYVGYLTQKFSGVGHHRSGIELVLGDHPIVEPLKRLGLPKQPLISSWMEHLEFSMSAPELLTK